MQTVAEAVTASHDLRLPPEHMPLESLDGEIPSKRKKKLLRCSYSSSFFLFDSSETNLDYWLLSQPTKLSHKHWQFWEGSQIMWIIMRKKKPTASQCPSCSSIIRCSFFTSALNQLLMMYVYIYIYMWYMDVHGILSYWDDSVLYVHSLHKVARIEAIPPSRRKKPRPGPVPSAPSAQPTERRSGAEVTDLRGNKNPQNISKTCRSHPNKRIWPHTFCWIGWPQYRSFIISKHFYFYCNVFFKIHLWSFLLSWRVPFFCRIPRDKSWICCVSQTKRSKDWGYLTRVDAFWCQTTSEMWVIYIEVLRSILRTFLVFDLSNTLTLINLNVTIRSIQ